MLATAKFFRAGLVYLTYFKLFLSFSVWLFFILFILINLLSNIYDLTLFSELMSILLNFLYNITDYIVNKVQNNNDIIIAYQKISFYFKNFLLILIYFIVIMCFLIN